MNKIKSYEARHDDVTNSNVSSYTVTNPDGDYAFTISHIRGYRIQDYVSKIVNFLTESREEIKGEYKKELTTNGLCLTVTDGSIFLFCPYFNKDTYLLHLDGSSLDNSKELSPTIVPLKGIILPKGRYFKLIFSNGICYNFLEGFEDKVKDRGEKKRDANIYDHYVLN